MIIAVKAVSRNPSWASLSVHQLLQAPNLFLHYKTNLYQTNASRRGSGDVRFPPEIIFRKSVSSSYEHASCIRQINLSLYPMKSKLILNVQGQCERMQLKLIASNAWSFLNNRFNIRMLLLWPLFWKAVSSRPRKFCFSLLDVCLVVGYDIAKYNDVFRNG